MEKFDRQEFEDLSKQQRSSQIDLLGAQTQKRREFERQLTQEADDLGEKFKLEKEKFIDGAHEQAIIIQEAQGELSYKIERLNNNLNVENFNEAIHALQALGKNEEIRALKKEVVSKIQNIFDREMNLLDREISKRANELNKLEEVGTIGKKAIQDYGLRKELQTLLNEKQIGRPKSLLSMCPILDQIEEESGGLFEKFKMSEDELEEFETDAYEELHRIKKGDAYKHGDSDEYDKMHQFCKDLSNGHIKYKREII